LILIIIFLIILDSYSFSSGLGNSPFSTGVIDSGIHEAATEVGYNALPADFGL
jgi:hypothetical protein